MIGFIYCLYVHPGQSSWPDDVRGRSRARELNNHLHIDGDPREPPVGPRRSGTCFVMPWGLNCAFRSFSGAHTRLPPAME
jgi:hypothetical protein